ncbi:MAG: 16S rRNA (cytosine(1402)-N(4))-methyltransferase RsmH [Clostridia bacterium]|nr:16S rRNA (cytosine(1402)-N(4))-methyltransferase RsmH [Clostridia bacterium]MDD4376016.1 16S rRNA (cytosine(1402)-N(4))-methyltransferase RsmH [Clostridia bacterium]
MKFNHIPVLKNESIEGLNIKESGTYVDGTLGGAGHSLLILERLNNKGLHIGIDRDEEALNVSKERLKQYSNFVTVHDNHNNILNILKEKEISAVDGILLDLGVSSYQLDEAERGFSYMHNAKLDMRMNKQDKITAKDIVNNYTEEELVKIFFDYGEERYSRKIARKIIEKREEKEIETTLELVEIIKSSLPGKALLEKQHPAKRIFQAIRIEVNNELSELKQTIKDCILALKPKGRLCIITFHSLEDRIVKLTYEELQGKCKCPADFPKCICNYISYGKTITKKPITESIEILKQNPRSRSAKLRIFERN